MLQRTVFLVQLENFYEILYSFKRQFGKEPWCLYTGRHLLSFVDNHDVNRIASQLENKKQLPAIYAMLFTMPGIPAVYYGSEWGMEGRKTRTIRNCARKLKFLNGMN